MHYSPLLKQGVLCTLVFFRVFFLPSVFERSNSFRTEVHFVLKSSVCLCDLFCYSSLLMFYSEERVAVHLLDK